MGHRLSKIYTRTGDDGSTGLGDGERVGKDDLRVCAYGSVDELNSHIGVVLTLPCGKPISECLEQVQHRLFDLGGELCIPGAEVIQDQHVSALEQTLDRFNQDLPALKDFILPGGNTQAAACHVARTVCRRAERDLVALSRVQQVRAETIRYLNRLSDLLFVLARVLARQDGGSEVLWQHDRC